MVINRETAATTIFDSQQRVLGMLTNRREPIVVALSLAPGGANRYWDDIKQCFTEGEVWWDGGKPDQYGGQTKGELLSPLFPDDALQWRLMGAPARSQARFWSRGANEENED